MSEQTAPDLGLLRELIGTNRQLSEAGFVRLEDEFKRMSGRINTLETGLATAQTELRLMKEASIRAEGRNEGGAAWTAKLWQIAAPLITALLAALAGAFWAKGAP